MSTSDLEIDHEDPRMIERFATAFEQGRLLSEFIPEPDYESWSPPEEGRLAEEFRRYGPEYYWREWRMEYWGAKFDTGLYPDDYSRIEKISSNRLKVRFNTSVCYPEQVCQEMMRLGYSIRGLISDDFSDIVYDNGVIEEIPWDQELVDTPSPDVEVAVVEMNEEREQAAS